MGTSGYWVVYDGKCRFCRKSVSWLRWLDWFGQVRLLDLHADADQISRLAPWLTYETMMQAMQLITPAGRVYAGFYALRRMAWVLPALWLAAPGLYLPGMSYLGPAVYRWIARRRYGLLPCGPDEACKL